MKRIFFIGVAFIFLSCSHKSENNTTIKIYQNSDKEERKYAEVELKECLSENKRHNVIHLRNKILKSSGIAVKIIEPILFDIYGVDNIKRQRPYKMSEFENHFVINGTLKPNEIGGTFLVIIDKRNAEILRITHGE